MNKISTETIFRKIISLFRPIYLNNIFLLVVFLVNEPKLHKEIFWVYWIVNNNYILQSTVSYKFKKTIKYNQNFNISNILSHNFCTNLLKNVDFLV